MDLRHETSRCKGIHISSGRVRLVKTGINRGEIIRCAHEQKDSLEVLLARFPSAIHLSPPFSSFPPVLLSGLRSRLHLHPWPLWEKYQMPHYHCSHSSVLQWPPANHICCLQADKQQHAAAHQGRVETTIHVDEKKGKRVTLIRSAKGYRHHRTCVWNT